jgi:hypothetical protein
MDRQKRALGNQISTVIKNVWISGLDYTYQASDWVITDNMTFEAENIFSTLANGNGLPAAQGGEINVKHMGAGLNGIVNVISGTNGSIINVEQIVDTGGGRGSMDAAGLIDIGSDASLF